LESSEGGLPLTIYDDVVWEICETIRREQGMRSHPELTTLNEGERLTSTSPDDPADHSIKVCLNSGVRPTPDPSVQELMLDLKAVSQKLIAADIVRI